MDKPAQAEPAEAGPPPPSVVTAPAAKDDDSTHDGDGNVTDSTLVTSAKAGREARRAARDETADSTPDEDRPAMLTWQEDDGYHFKPNAALEAKMAEVSERYEGLGTTGFETPAAAKRKLKYALNAMLEVLDTARWVQVQHRPDEDD